MKSYRKCWKNVSSRTKMVRKVSVNADSWFPSAVSEIPGTADTGVESVENEGRAKKWRVSEVASWSDRTPSRKRRRR